MPAQFETGPYDPCPCGSGKKYKFCCAEKAKANRHGKFPMGTIALYGPDDKTTTKIAACVLLRDDDDPIIERFHGDNVKNDPKAAEQIKRFFASHGTKSVVMTEGNIGCPHEEGKDFPFGKDCPLCPFWAGKQGTARRSQAESLDDLGTDDDTDDEDESDEDLGDEVEQGIIAAEDAEDGEESPYRTADELDETFERLGPVIGGDDVARDEAIERIAAHLKANLVMPCRVTGGEDFRWEEPYVIGGWDLKEYRRLCKTQPSYQDEYDVISLEYGRWSEWMMYRGEDIAVTVRRTSDGKKFVLGLAELEAVDKKSPNHQLLDDYVLWFANTR